MAPPNFDRMLRDMGSYSARIHALSEDIKRLEERMELMQVQLTSMALQRAEAVGGRKYMLSIFAGAATLGALVSNITDIIAFLK